MAPRKRKLIREPGLKKDLACALRFPAGLQCNRFELATFLRTWDCHQDVEKSFERGEVFTEGTTERTP